VWRDGGRGATAAHVRKGAYGEVVVGGGVVVDAHRGHLGTDIYDVGVGWLERSRMPVWKTNEQTKTIKVYTKHRFYYQLLYVIIGHNFCNSHSN
jgi:hypothetical protein